VKVRLAPLLILLLAAAGCTHTPPTTKGALFTPSPFLQRLEWDTLVNTPAQEEGRQRKWDSHRVRDFGEPEMTPERHVLRPGFEGVFHFEDADGQRVECRKEDLRRYMDAVRKDLRKQIEPGAAEPPVEESDDRGTTYGFEISYKAGNTSGRVTGTGELVGAGKESAIKVTIRLEEEIRP
jgi:hypothetical protein